MFNEILVELEKNECYAESDSGEWVHFDDKASDSNCRSEMLVL